MESRCIKWGQRTRKDCAESRDEGYSACERYEDHGYDTCSEWAKNCKKPFRWLCKFFSWICIAWVWFSSWVCVAWYWISNIVCVAYTYIVEAFCLLFEALIGLGKELWNIGTDIVWRIIGVGDVIIGVFGWMPQKKLRIVVILLKDEKGNLVADKEMVLEEINKMIEIYNAEANTKVIVKGLNNDSANANCIIELTTDESDGILDVSCSGTAVLEDYSTQGAKFSALAVAKGGGWGNINRVTGYGCPITVFIVRSIVGADGCSINLLSNYGTVVGKEITDKTTIAHECGHSCILSDMSHPNTNLMYEFSDPQRYNLTKSQKILLRDSKHVTYL